jgi:predicted dehydrogenase
MSSRVCRWGILGTAGIARKNWRALRLSGNGTVAAVASRSLESANRFIDECSAEVPFSTRPDAVASYEALLERKDIDVIYIPLPTALRKEWVIRAAKAGKHVLGEKPAALNATEVAEMLEACKQNKVQYMDGVMFMHSQRLPALRAVLDDRTQLGQLRRMSSNFSFRGDAEFQSSNIRTSSELEPYGCLGDLGWYCVRFFLWTMKGQMPNSVRARTLTPLQGKSSSAAVPGEFSAELIFNDGVSANFYCSFVTNHQQWVHLSGSEGWMRLNDFVLPYHAAELEAVVGKDHFHIENCTFNMEHHQQRIAVNEYGSGHQNAQEVRMIQTFCDIVLSGTLDAQWPTWTLNTQRVLDACFQSAASDGHEVKL